MTGAERQPCGVRSARKTVRWTVFSGERAEAPGIRRRGQSQASGLWPVRQRRKRGVGPMNKASRRAAALARSYCELRPEAKRRRSVAGFGAPGKQPGGLFSAKNRRQPGAGSVASGSKAGLRGPGKLSGGQFSPSNGPVGPGQDYCEPDRAQRDHRFEPCCDGAVAQVTAAGRTKNGAFTTEEVAECSVLL